MRCKILISRYDPLGSPTQEVQSQDQYEQQQWNQNNFQQYTCKWSVYLQIMYKVNNL